MAYYNGCKSGKLEHYFVGSMYLNICVKEDYSDIAVSMAVSDTVHSADGQFDWTMTLQRYDYGWKDVASRTGYINPDSPSNRTFTNVKNGENRTHRIKVVFKSHDKPNQTRYSAEWSR